MTTTLVAGREDGLGARLANMLYVQAMARAGSCNVKLLWRESLPRVHCYGGGLEDIFSGPTLSLFERINTKVSVWVAQNLEDGWTHCDRFTPEYRNGRLPAGTLLAYRQLFKELTFTPRLQQIMQDIDIWFEDSGNTPWTGVHVRAGDVETATVRWFGNRYYPLAIYDLLFESLKSQTCHLYVASNSADAIRHYTRSLHAFCFDDIVSATDLRSIERDVLEIYILSKCQCIHAPSESGFTIAASMIGGTQVCDVGETVMGPELKTIMTDLMMKAGHEQVEAIRSEGIRLLRKNPDISPDLLLDGILSIGWKYQPLRMKARQVSSSSRVKGDRAPDTQADEDLE